jgi:hypothetical protein
MNEDCLKLTTYFGERDRAGDGLLSDALIDLYARRGLETSVLLRGIEGFGIKQRLQTQQLLTLSEDLPVDRVLLARARAPADPDQYLGAGGLRGDREVGDHRSQQPLAIPVGGAVGRPQLG